MAMVDLKGVYIVTAKGRPYHYAWRGGPRIKAAPGTEAYIAELALHRAARNGGDPGRISGLCIEWKRSDRWALPADRGGMADSTKQAWRRWLDEIQRHFGPLRIQAFDDPKIRVHIKKWRDKWKATPRAADMAKQTLSALLAYAVEEGKLNANPCLGISNLYQNDRADRVWDEASIAAVEAGASVEQVQAFRLARLTGLRLSDLLKLSWGHIGELAVEIRTGKSGERTTAVIPRYAELDELLASIPKRATTVLTNSRARPWTKGGFSSSWDQMLKRLPPGSVDDLHFHDARGTFATHTYASGVFTVREIAEMLGWSEDKVEKIINKYVRKDALLRDRIRRMDEARKNTGGTESAKPSAKPVRRNSPKTLK